MRSDLTTAKAPSHKAKNLPISTLERGSFVLAALGLALCISTPEAARYSALWHISDEGGLPGVVVKAAFLLVCYVVVRRAALRGRVPLHRNRPLIAVLVILQTVGFVLYIASSCGWDGPMWTTMVRSALLDSSFFLFAAFASFYLRTDTKTAVTSFIVGVVVAGTVQICMAFLPFPVAVGCVVLFAPLSAVCLLLADRRVLAAERWYSALSDHERAVFEDEAQSERVAATSAGELSVPEDDADDKGASSMRGGLYATIALLSFIVAAIHLSWLGIQDGEAASVMVQVCAGIGAVLGGNILYAMRRSLEDREVVEFARLIVLPVAIGTLYVATMLTGSLVALAVIPLNIVYVAVMLLAWLAPFVYANRVEPIAASCDAFLAKRLGVVVGIGLMRDLAVGELAWLSGLLIMLALVGIVTLSVGQFIRTQRRAERAAARPAVQVSLDAEETRNLACALVAERFRLTPRERDVLELLVRGRTASYIAEELVISSTTAKTHIKHIYQKAGVQSKQTLLDIVEVELQHLANRDVDDCKN